MLDQITPLVIAYNEAPNLLRTLQGLKWAQEILVVDSFSTDETIDIAASFSQVRVLQHKFESFANQCNFGISHVKTRWVLSLDADYVLTPEFAEELRKLQPDSSTGGYRASFKYCIYGVALRGTLYPPRTVLYRKDQSRYEDSGHGHRVCVEGKVTYLRTPILHDDRKPFSRWLDSQRNYAVKEAHYLLENRCQRLSWMDWLRSCIVLAAPVALVYTLIYKRCLFDGWRGWYYTLQRTYFEILLSLELLDQRLRRSSGESMTIMSLKHSDPPKLERKSIPR